MGRIFVILQAGQSHSADRPCWTWHVQIMSVEQRDIGGLYSE